MMYLVTVTLEYKTYVDFVTFVTFPSKRPLRLCSAHWPY